MNKIKTFVFFDLETTGLPHMENNLTKITELCMIACSKDSLLSSVANQLPRVLHKLSLCINPFKRIAPMSTKITGLDNFMLEPERKFDENTVKLITHFIEQLQKPICLIAHNGNRFDFPIFKKELNKVKMDLPSDVWCVDSIDIFKKIDALKMFQEKTESINTEDAIGELSAIVSSSTDIDSTSHNDKNLLNDGNDWIISTANEMQKRNETTPSHRPEKHGKFKYVKPKNEAITPTTDCVPEIPRTVKSRRALFPELKPEKKNAQPKNSKKKLYNLIAIYERLYGSEPEVSHFAESDTITLIKCAIASKEGFVKFVEEDAKLFSVIKPI